MTNPIDELRERGLLPDIVTAWQQGACPCSVCAFCRGSVNALAALALDALKRVERAEGDNAELLAASLDAAQDNVRLRAERSALKAEVAELEAELSDGASLYRRFYFHEPALDELTCYRRRLARYEKERER